MSLYDCLGYLMGVTVAQHNRSLSGTPPDDTLLTTPSRQAPPPDDTLPSGTPS